jgi:hypothetical protein
VQGIIHVQFELEKNLKTNNNNNGSKVTTISHMILGKVISTIYEFNTSSEFRGFTYILNYFDASNTCASF